MADSLLGGYSNDDSTVALPPASPADFSFDDIIGHLANQYTALSKAGANPDLIDKDFERRKAVLENLYSRYGPDAFLDAVPEWKQQLTDKSQEQRTTAFDRLETTPMPEGDAKQRADDIIQRQDDERNGTFGTGLLSSIWQAGSAGASKVMLAGVGANKIFNPTAPDLAYDPAFAYVQQIEQNKALVKSGEGKAAQAGSLLGGFAAAPAAIVGAGSEAIEAVDKGQSLGSAYTEGGLDTAATMLSLAAGNLGNGLPSRMIKQGLSGGAIYGAELSSRKLINQVDKELGGDGDVVDEAPFSFGELGKSIGLAAAGGALGETPKPKAPFIEPGIPDGIKPRLTTPFAENPTQGELPLRPVTDKGTPTTDDLFGGESVPADTAEATRQLSEQGLSKEAPNRTTEDEAYLQRDYLAQQEAKSVNARSSDTAIGQAMRAAGVETKPDFEPSTNETVEQPEPQQGQLALQTQNELPLTGGGKDEGKATTEAAVAKEDTTTKAPKDDSDAVQNALKWAEDNSPEMASEEQIAALKAKNWSSADPRIADIVGGNRDLLSKLNNGKLTVRDVLNHVAENGIPEQKAWARDTLDQGKTLGGLDVPVKIYNKNIPEHVESNSRRKTPETTPEGWYDPKAQTVFIHPDTVQPHIDLLNHESTHAVEVHALGQGSRGTLRPEAQTAYNRLSRLFEKTKDAIRRQALVRMGGRDLVNDPVAKREFAHLTYGLKNLVEFHAELRANQNLRTLLKSMKIEDLPKDGWKPGDLNFLAKARNLWDAIGRTYDKMLGRTQGHSANLYDMMVDHQQQLKKSFGPDASQYRKPAGISLKEALASPERNTSTAQDKFKAPSRLGTAVNRIVGGARHIAASVRAPREVTLNATSAAIRRVQDTLKDADKMARTEKVAPDAIDAYLKDPSSKVLDGAPATKAIIDAGYHNPLKKDTAGVVGRMLRDPNRTASSTDLALDLQKNPHQFGPVNKAPDFVPLNDSRAEAIRTAADRAQTAAHLKGMDVLHEQGLREGWLNQEQTKAHSTSIDNARAGSLRGMYTAPAIKDMLGEHFGGIGRQNFTFSDVMGANTSLNALNRWVPNRVVSGWQRVVRGTKLARLVSDPGYYVMYGLGGPSIMMNGGVSPVGMNFVRGVKLYAAHNFDSVRSTLSPKSQLDLADSRKMGLVESTAFGEGLTYQQKRTFEKLLSNVDGPRNKFLAGIQDFLAKVPSASTHVLAATDAYAKIAVGLKRRDVLKKFYERQGKKGNPVPNHDDILREAGDWTNDVTMTYHRTATGSRFLESMGASQGLNYGVETIRNSVYSVMHAYQDVARGAKAGDVPMMLNGIKQGLMTSANVLYASKVINGLAHVAVGAAGLASATLLPTDKKQEFLQEEGSRYRGQRVDELSDPSNPNSKYTYLWTPADRNEYYYQVSQPIHVLVDAMQGGPNGPVDKLDKVHAAFEALTGVFLNNAAVTRTSGLIQGKVPYWEKTKASEQYQAQHDAIINKFAANGIHVSDANADRLIAFEEFLKPGIVRNAQIANESHAPIAIKAMMTAGLGVQELGKDTGLSDETGAGTAARVKQQLKDAHKTALNDFTSRADLSDQALENSYKEGLKESYKATRSLKNAYDFGEAEGVAKGPMLLSSKSGGLDDSTSAKVLFGNNLNPAIDIHQNFSGEISKAIDQLKDDPVKQHKVIENYIHKMQVLNSLTSKYMKLTPEQIEAL